MHIINGNYGNHTIALIQWVFLNDLADRKVVSVDTQWQAQTWQSRVEEGEALAKRCGFNVVRLKGRPSFETLMRDRNEFPSTKFQWCAGFLKGLPLLDWLDEVDPSCEATILLGKRRADSRANAHLPEFIEASEHYGDRKIWYPLYNHDDAAFQALIKEAGFPFLPHRSLECDPCIHSSESDLRRMHTKDIEKTVRLEQEINKTLFLEPIEKKIQIAKENQSTCSQNISECFDMGCGSPFGCGE